MFNPAEMAKDVEILLRCQKEIEGQISTTIPPGIEKLERCLEEARRVALKYKPDDYTIRVGVPFGITVSFTWHSE